MRCIWWLMNPWQPDSALQKGKAYFEDIKVRKAKEKADKIEMMKKQRQVRTPDLSASICKALTILSAAWCLLQNPYTHQVWSRSCIEGNDKNKGSTSSSWFRHRGYKELCYVFLWRFDSWFGTWWYLLCRRCWSNRRHSDWKKTKKERRNVRRMRCSERQRRPQRWKNKRNWKKNRKLSSTTGWPKRPRLRPRDRRSGI